METKTNKRARPNAGRKPKPHKEKWGQITCVLKLETIKALREAAKSNRFGEYLQAHLEANPPIYSKDELDEFNKWTFVKAYPTASELRARARKEQRDLLRKNPKSKPVAAKSR